MEGHPTLLEMAARVLEMKTQLEKVLRDGTKPWTFVLDVAEARTGVNRLYLFVGK